MRAVSGARRFLWWYFEYRGGVAGDAGLDEEVPDLALGVDAEDPEDTIGDYVVFAVLEVRKALST